MEELNHVPSTTIDETSHLAKSIDVTEDKSLSDVKVLTLETSIEAKGFFTRDDSTSWIQLPNFQSYHSIMIPILTLYYHGFQANRVGISQHYAT